MLIDRRKKNFGKFKNGGLLPYFKYVCFVGTFGCDGHVVQHRVMNGVLFILNSFYSTKSKHQTALNCKN